MFSVCQSETATSLTPFYNMYSCCNRFPLIRVHFKRAFRSYPPQNIARSFSKLTGSNVIVHGRFSNPINFSSSNHCFFSLSNWNSQAATTTLIQEKFFERASFLFKTSSILKILLGSLLLQYYLVDVRKSKFKKYWELFRIQKPTTEIAYPLESEMKAISNHLVSNSPKILLLSGPQSCGKLLLLQVSFSNFFFHFPFHSSF